MNFDKKASGGSLELVVLGLIAALVCSLAFPLFPHVTQKDPHAFGTEAVPAAPRDQSTN